MISKDGSHVDSVPYRKETFAAQAPQSFYLKDIIAAHDAVRSTPTKYENMVDACTIIRSQGLKHIWWKETEAILKLRHRKMCIRFVHCYSTKRMNRHLDWVLQIV